MNNNNINKLKINNIVMAIVMFVVCTSLVSIMFMQFKTVEETDITDIENMREVELRKTLAEWKSKYEETNIKLEETQKKIDEYNEKIGKKEETSELVEQELKQSNLFVGKTDVVGEGVIITLDNAEKNVVASDLIYLINELRYAGAEAISINDVRIINTTEVVDLMEYTYISVGGQRLESPYVVKAIGDKEYMSGILNMKDSGYVDINKNGTISVQMETSKRVEISKYNGEMDYKYMKEKEE